MSYSLPFSPSGRDTEQELRKRMPQLQPAAAPHDSQTALASRAEQMKPPAADTARSAPSSTAPPSSASHQRFVLTDHVAFRYLADDASTTVLARREKLEGYEIYLVEQWACSRSHPTFIITTYTGDPKDSVWASVISVPKDESAWSPQMRLYFKMLDQYHARRKETSLGTLMITNLSGFPSSLTVIPVPNGDARANRELFFVNENLKRLGCSGRLGIKLAPPSSATQAKFHQLYRTSDKIPLNSSVIELVKLCQVALVLFGKLEPAYADGLLCDLTEKAVNDWWVEFGAEYYTVEPHDGILGPTTVAALLGMLMGARNRLSAFNAPVAKDVFDIDSTKRGIAYFQKTQRLQKTRRLDRQTLERLRRATAKAASKESWAVPRAFKTTVAELGGKGGEMVMGMVGAGEKAGIADIETVDIERFVELVSGERAKWLWYGKPRKTNTGDMFSRLPKEERSESPEENGSHIANLLKRESTLEGHSITKRDTIDETKRLDATGNAEAPDKERDPNSKRAAIKRATEKIESGSGFHRIKEVVGRRNHQSKPSKDESMRSPLHRAKSDLWSPTRQSIDESFAPSLQDRSRNDALDDEPTFTRVLTETPRDSASTLAVDKAVPAHVDDNNESTVTLKPPSLEDEAEESRPPTIADSIAGSIYRGIDLNDKLSTDETHDAPPFLRRTQSASQLGQYHANTRNENWWPRHLSFSIAEESVLRWPSIVATSLEEDATSTCNLRAALAANQLHSEETLRLRHHLTLLSTIDAPWVTTALSTITDLESRADADILQLESLYYPRLDTYQSLREDAHEIISTNRARLQESLRDLGNSSDKLEYEIGTLRSKVDDVEDGIVELERQVEFLEGRVGELEGVCREREGWGRWIVRVLTGVGKAPG